METKITDFTCYGCNEIFTSNSFLSHKVFCKKLSIEERQKAEIDKLKIRNDEMRFKYNELRKKIQDIGGNMLSL